MIVDLDQFSAGDLRELAALRQMREDRELWAQAARRPRATPVSKSEFQAVRAALFACDWFNTSSEFEELVAVYNVLADRVLLAGFADDLLEGVAT